MAEEEPLLVQDWSQLIEDRPIELLVKRDDLLPFPLAGNKVRKLSAELDLLDVSPGDVVITNGGLASNYSRTLAFMAAARDAQAHLVLHPARSDSTGSTSISMRLYEALGARSEVVPADAIAEVIELARQHYRRRGRTVHVLSGGGHSAAGAEASRIAASQTIRALPPLDAIFVASGTGATQAGIAVAANQESPGTRVVGVSIARDAVRGKASVLEAVSWLVDPVDFEVEFDDRFRDGGYGTASSETQDIVDRAWRRGLPLDGVYTGKAFRGMTNILPELRRGARVLFWHTGGLVNYLEQ